MIHTVQRGDTLTSIALRYGSTVNRIAEMNNIKDVNKIRVGQQLKIPIVAPTLNTALEQCLSDIEKLDSFKLLQSLL